MNYSDIQEIIEECPNLPIFKNNKDLRKEYSREWQKYLKHKRSVYSQIDDKSLDANMVSEANWILRNKHLSCESFGVNAQTGDMEIEIYKSKNCSSRNDTGGNLYDCTTAAEGRGTQNTDGWCDGTKHQRRDG